jgi:hypothetical protein
MNPCEDSAHRDDRPINGRYVLAHVSADGTPRLEVLCWRHFRQHLRSIKVEVRRLD